MATLLTGQSHRAAAELAGALAGAGEPSHYEAGQLGRPEEPGDRHGSHPRGAACARLRVAERRADEEEEVVDLRGLALRAEHLARARIRHEVLPRAAAQ